MYPSNTDYCSELINCRNILQQCCKLSVRLDVLHPCRYVADRAIGLNLTYCMYNAFPTCCLDVISFTCSTEITRRHSPCMHAPLAKVRHPPLAKVRHQGNENGVTGGEYHNTFLLAPTIMSSYEWHILKDKMFYQCKLMPSGCRQAWQKNKLLFTKTMAAIRWPRSAIPIRIPISAFHLPTSSFHFPM